ncbi:thiol-disulfide oxidoreductase LTO1-like [Helianthus annuus]|uniref:thiol-disulfide oxidoreductase LTO1-like n=1 Tax=Helianthus annuus TaxID=4232 RepID=UPI001652C29E|nr:thiol-disulfide oxidoreductase LTO1-like [Helianthus annuus]
MSSPNLMHLNLMPRKRKQEEMWNIMICYRVVQPKIPVGIRGCISCWSSGSGIGSGISSYTWCTGLGGLGFLETSYLSYLKFTGSDAFCPIGGGSCGDVLNSSYAAVFGIHLPFIGMVAYGAATFLALKLAAKDLPFGIDESNGGLILLGTTTSMATTSAYFLYILNTQFVEATCSYCLASILLSFSLFFRTAKVYVNQ